MPRLSTIRRNCRAIRLMAGAWAHPDRPVLVHLVPMRRCNIDCGYCNEFDKISQPVPLAQLLARVDALARLRTVGVAFSGGEPLLHPDLDAVIRAIRRRGMLAGLITNGYLLSPPRIRALNEAGLDFCQISIDNVEPDEVSKKSLRLLDRKLEWLAAHATFDVTVNSVLGSGVRRPEDAQAITERARALGFSTSLGIIHDSQGHLRPLDEATRRIFDAITGSLQPREHLYKNLYSGLRGFQENLVSGRPNQWSCRAGARYLYVCEHGLVHFCSQQRGTPGVPLARYSVDDIRRHFVTPKSCAPYCTIGCVHRVSVIDALRKPHGVEEPVTTTLRRA